MVDERGEENSTDYLFLTDERNDAESEREKT